MAAGPNVSDPLRIHEEKNLETPAEPEHRWYLDPTERQLRQQTGVN